MNFFLDLNAYKSKLYILLLFFDLFKIYNDLLSSLFQVKLWFCIINSGNSSQIIYDVGY